MAGNNANNLLDAISIVAEGVVKKYQYDQTIEAKIVSTARRDQGIYKCEYENAIFDAYSNDSFYENETVYVNVPKGDFSKQKHIVGRKVDLETEPDRTFNFKMPFDDFVGLESLTADEPYIRADKDGFWANYAKHGCKEDVDNQYLTILQGFQSQLRDLDGVYTTEISTIETNKQSLQRYISNEYLNTLNAAVYASGSRLQLYKIGDDTILDLMVSAYRTANLVQVSELINAFIQIVNPSNDERQVVALGQEDVNILNDIAEQYERTAKNDAKHRWEQQRQVIIQNMNTATASYTNTNYNHLWSWVNPDEESKPLITTKLGVSVNIQTDLRNYFPSRGEYGLRIVITGITKATQEEAATTKTSEIYWTNDQMYGNTYAFYTPYRQQRVIDISNYLSLDRVDVFFYQNTDSVSKQGTFKYNGQTLDKVITPNFISDQGETIPFTYTDVNGQNVPFPYNIYYSGLEVFLGLTTDECSTDRTLLYTYDEVLYGEDPFDTNSRVTKDKRELKFAWIHKTDSGQIVLVDHVQKKFANDLCALETYNAQIYWYHYQYKAPQDTDQLVYKYGGVNWEFLQTEKEILSRTLKNELGEEYTENYESYCKFNITVVPDITKAHEKWKAVVVCNNVPHTSQPIVFTNIDTGVETEAADRINEVAFKILRESRDENGNKIVIEDNSLTNFFVYDEEGLCIQNDENDTWSDLWFYIQVWIRNNEDGSYLPLALAVDDIYQDNTFEIDWQLPGANSMLSNISPVTNTDLQNAALAPTVEENQEGYNAVIRKSTRKFQIQHRWDTRAINNTIAAVVKRNGRIYKIQQEFMFGQSGSMGTPYTVVLTQDTPQNGNMIKDEEFQVRAIVYDSTGREVPNKNYVFTWQLLAPTIITSGRENRIDTLPQDTGWKVAWSNITALDDNKGNRQNVIKGYIRNDFPPVFKVSVRGAADYEISATRGFSLIGNEAINSSYEISCPSKVEFKSDGKIPLTITAPFAVNLIQSAVAKQAIHPDWDLTQYVLGNDQTWREVVNKGDIVGVGLKSVPVAQVNLVSNLNPSVYLHKDNSGYNFDAGFSLTATDICNELSDYESIRNQINQLYDRTVEADIDADEEVLNNYLTQRNERLNALNRAVSTVVPSYTEYSLDPYVHYSPNRAVPWQWRNELATSYYTIIHYGSGNAYFKQAIAFTRNVYSSSLVNSWDGSTLELDDANSAVLAKMISAGAKDGDGRFTGVMMGDWHEKADSSLDTPGLYGVKYGEQVFGFLTDGTGFIGKAGRGRIEFDGNKSLISNSDKTCYLNLDPIVYTVKNNSVVNINNYSGYSQYFLYSKVPKKTLKMTPGNEYETLTESTYWAQTFMEDSENDYFVVDPNNGVLTTGGVIARYGKIGNWMISSSGLYQRKIDQQNAANNRYMYLGYADLTDADYTTIETKYNALYDALDTKYNIALENADIKFKAEEISELGKYYKQIFNHDPLHYYNFGWPYESYINALDDTLGNTIGANSSTIKSVLQANLKKYIEAETRNGYHRHFLNGEPTDEVQYTGDREVFCLFANGMYVFAPLGVGDITVENIWSDTNHYREGEHLIVQFYTPSHDEGQQENLPTGETYEVIITDEETNETTTISHHDASNIDNNIYTPTNYYSYSYTENGRIQLTKIYQTEYNPLIIEYNPAGYSSNEEIWAAYYRLPLEYHYGVCAGYDESHRLKFYFYSGGVIFSSSSGEGSGGDAGGGGGSGREPAPYVIPQQTRTYYSDNDESKSWENVHQRYGVEETNVTTIDFEFASTYTREHLQKIRTMAYALYRYYTDAYTAQLNEMLQAGIEELEGQALADYQIQVAEMQTKKQNYILTIIDPLFADLRARLDAQKAKEVNALISASDDRYAIFAGYNPDSAPMFSVNWKGYMTARAGRIGIDSPWYIGDMGLTQKNNSGTIFLGDPETSSNTLKTTVANGTTVNIFGPDGSTINLLPNDAINGEVVWLKSYIPNPSNPSTTIEHYEDSRGKFAIYAGDTKVRFGVRMDGTLLATQANIGGWLVDDTTMRTLPAKKTDNSGNLVDDFSNQIILDSSRNVMIFGGSGGTIIYGNGMLRLSAYQGPTEGIDGSGLYAGTINLGGFFLQGMTIQPRNLDKVLIGMTHTINTIDEIPEHCGQYQVHYGYYGDVVFSSKTFRKTTGTSDTVNVDWNNNNPNIFKLFDSTRALDLGGAEASVNIGINVLTGLIGQCAETTTGETSTTGAALTTEQQAELTRLTTELNTINGTNALTKKLNDIINALQTVKSVYNAQSKIVNNIVDYIESVTFFNLQDVDGDGIPTIAEGLSESDLARYRSLSFSSISQPINVNNNSIAAYRTTINTGVSANYANSSISVVKNCGQAFNDIQALLAKADSANINKQANRYVRDGKIYDYINPNLGKSSSNAIYIAIRTLKYNTDANGVSLYECAQNWTQYLTEIIDCLFTLQTLKSNVDNYVSNLQGQINALNSLTGATSITVGTGVTQGSNTALVVYPVGTSNSADSTNHAVLGTTSARWNLNAETIDAYNIAAKNIFITDGLYVAGDKIATEQWTMKWIDWLADQIKKNAGGGGGGTSGSFSAGSALGKALQALLGGLTLWGGNGAIPGLSTSTQVVTYGGQYQGQLATTTSLTIPLVTFTVNDDSGNGAKNASGSKAFTKSQVTLNLSADNLGIGGQVVGSVNGIGNLSGTIHAGFAKVVSDANSKFFVNVQDPTTDTKGVVTFKFDTATKSAARTITFDQAGTKFYKDHAVHIFKVGNSQHTAKTAGIGLVAGETWDAPNAGDSITGVTWTNTTTKQIGAFTYSIQNLSGSSILSGTISVSGESPYVAGWNDALAACSLTNTIDYPSNNSSGYVTATAVVTVTPPSGGASGRHSYIGASATDCTKEAYVKETFVKGTAGTAGSAGSFSYGHTSAQAETGGNRNFAYYSEASDNAKLKYIHYNLGTDGTPGTAGSLTWSDHKDNQ